MSKKYCWEYFRNSKIPKSRSFIGSIKTNFLVDFKKDLPTDVENMNILMSSKISCGEPLMFGKILVSQKNQYMKEKVLNF